VTIYRILSGISLIQWLWTAVPAAIAAVLAVVDGQPLSVVFVAALGAAVVMVIGLKLWSVLSGQRPKTKKAPVDNGSQAAESLFGTTVSRNTIGGLVEDVIADKRAHRQRAIEQARLGNLRGSTFVFHEPQAVFAREFLANGLTNSELIRFPMAEPRSEVRYTISVTPARQPLRVSAMLSIGEGPLPDPNEQRYGCEGTVRLNDQCEAFLLVRLMDQTSAVICRVFCQSYTRGSNVIMEVSELTVGSPSHARGQRVEDKVSLLGGILYVNFRDWDHTIADLTPDDQILFLNGGAKRLQQAAAEGELDLFGLPNRNVGSHVKLPVEIWQDQQIDRMSVFPSHGTGARTECLAHGTKQRHPIYHDLLVRKSDMERLYPPRAPETMRSD
jgi:hypothetical protein